jgi:GNAT superfamily N-acetyltransferase
MGYRVHEAGLGDRAALERLWRTSVSDPRVGERLDQRFRWLYEEYPGARARTWLVAWDDTDEVVGCGTLLPRWFLHEGQRIQAGMLCDFAVSPAHRLAGAAVTLQRAIAEGSLDAGFQFVYGHPNRQALPVFKRVGYATVCETRQWRKPLRVEAKLRPRTGALLARAGGLVGDRLLATADRLLLSARGRGYGGRLLDSFESLDDLWSRGERGTSLTPERSAALARWRYERHPTEDISVFCLEDRSSDAPCACIVYQRTGDVVSVIDAVWNGPWSLFETSMLYFGTFMRRDRANVIMLTHAGDDSVTEHLSRLLFLERRGSRQLVCYVDRRQPAELKSLVTDPGSWSVFAGDLDI